MHKIEMVEHSDLPKKDKNEKLDVLMTSCVNGVAREVGCHFSPSGSNSKNENKSPMLIPILFHEVIINKSICHGFFSVHCIQFSQLSDLDIVRSWAQVRS